MVLVWVGYGFGMGGVLRLDAVMARVAQRPEFGEMLAEGAKAEKWVAEMQGTLGNG